MYNVYTMQITATTERVSCVSSAATDHIAYRPLVPLYKPITAATVYILHNKRTYI